MLAFRLLHADEIEVRISCCGSWGVQLLLYKNARADMNLLDETVGPENWQRRHECINGNLFCSVGIRIEREDGAEWIWKQDVGVESNTEKEKGESSDSFKRACFSWGCGRELYTSPAMFVRSGDLKTLEDHSGRWTCKDHFTVVGIEYDGRRIASVEILNDKTGKVLTFSDRKTSSSAPKTGRIGSPEIARLKMACEAAGDQWSLEKAVAACKRSDVSEITYTQYKALMEQLGAAA